MCLFDLCSAMPLTVIMLKIIYCFGLFFVIYSVITSSFLVYLVCACLLYICMSAIEKRTIGKIQVKGQGVYITGCDTGFGHDLAVRLDELGFTVFAGCLRPSGKGAKKLKSVSSRNLHIVPVDVGNDESVAKAHQYVVNHLPQNGLWGIVNNAGFNVMGDVEWLTVNLYQKAMNVNFYGAVRTIRNFLYLVRKSKGRVVIVTSVKGLYPFPANSAYHATKHGLETMADALRLEMLKFDVKVSVVEPGDFSAVTASSSPEHFVRYKEEADEMWESSSDDVKQMYGREYLDAQIEEQAQGTSHSAKTTKPVIDALVDGLISERPQTRYLVDGGDSFIDKPTTLARYYRYLPTWLSDHILVKWTGCDKPIEKSKRKEGTVEH